MSAKPAHLVDIIIPARAGSTRFANKPLAVLAGTTVLQRTWRLACAAHAQARVTVCSDDPQILAHAQGFGARVQLVQQPCRNGTERVARCVQAMGDAAELVVNLQGDAVLTPPWLIADAIAALQRDAAVPVVTPIVPLDRAAFADYCRRKQQGQASGTLAVAGLNGTALYFSKGIVPHWREAPAMTDDPERICAWRHVGLYAMRKACALHYLQLAPTPLETAEQLEQLRWLEHGLPVTLVQCVMRGRSLWSIDHPEDLQVAAEIIAAQGELL